MPSPEYRVTSEPDIERLVGSPMEYIRLKIATRLTSTMREFIQRSPFALVSTIDEAGMPDVSPKGDPPGFVRVESDLFLLIPERLGNRLTLGFRNLLRRPQIGLIFLVPRQRETLRIKGAASLHCDPDVLRDMQVQGKPALLYTRVAIQECFFHCGKALIRSHLWQPGSWDAESRSIAARQFGPQPATDEHAVRRTEAALERAYDQELY